MKNNTHPHVGRHTQVRAIRNMRIVRCAAVAIATLTVNAAFADDWTIDTPNDDGSAGSLRSLIASAKNDDRVLIPAGWTVVVDSSIQINVNTKNFSIVGLGDPESTTITNTASSYVFDIFSSVNYPKTGVIANLGFVGCVNTNATNGGAIRINPSHTNNRTEHMLISNCVFRANGVDGGNKTTGGAIYASLRNLEIIDCVFDGNRAANTGGALYIDAFNATVLRCAFTNNLALGLDSAAGYVYANGGGAIATPNSGGNALLIRESSFVDNNSNDRNGGAIQSQVRLTVEDSVFIGNGATAVQGTGAAVWSRSFNNSSPYFRRCVFKGHASAITTVRIEGSYDAAFEDCLFEENTSAISFAGATAGNTNYTTRVVERCVFRGNGSVLGMADGFFKVKDCLFEYNINPTRDNLIWLGAVDVALENCTFANNMAKQTIIHIQSGGNADAPASFVNCTFTKNTATDRSVIYNHTMNNYVSMVNCTIWSNTIPQHAIYSAEGWNGVGTSNFVMTNCVVAGNSNSSGDAATGAWRGIQTIANCAFTEPDDSGFIKMQNESASYENNIWGVTPARAKFNAPDANEINWSFLDGKKLPTLATDAGSVLRDAGTSDIDSAILSDARGFPRRDGISQIPDIGAYEFAPMLSTLMIVR